MHCLIYHEEHEGHEETGEKDGPGFPTS